MAGSPNPWPLFDLRLRTERLELRPPTDADLAALIEVAKAGVHDPAEMPFAVAWTDLPSPEFERSFLQFHWQARAEWRPESWRLSFAVLHHGQEIGVQEIWAKRFPLLRVVETGSWLGEPWQRRGFGTEMRAAVLAFAFEGLGAIAARSGALEGNDASRRVSEKLGYEPDGIEMLAPRGQRVVEQRLLLRRERWHPNRYPVRIERLDACRWMFGLREGGS